MNKFSMFFSRLKEGIKNAIISVLAGSILSTLIVYLIGFREITKEYEEELPTMFILLVLFCLFFAIPAIVPYLVAGVVAEFFKLPSWGVIILALSTLFYHHYFSIDIGFKAAIDIDSASDYIFLLIRYIPVFIIFLFVSLYGRRTSQPPTG